jgi:transcriptional regulator with XRE-family HTH domain
MGGIGSKLRDARQQWQLTLREVEDRSSRIAQRWENPAYRISASWLDRVERENRGLSATKLIVLAVIYGLSAEQMIALCPTPNSTSLETLKDISIPNNTQLLESGLLERQARQWLPDSLVAEAPPDSTMLLPAVPGTMPSHYRRGIIGKRDRILDPMIRAGSIVLIDTQKRAIASRREWTHEFDRPVYFLIAHTGYVAGFCELDKEAEWLTLVPHPLSYESSRRWRFRKEIEVVGTVAAFFARRTD